jgi:Transposase
MRLAARSSSGKGPRPAGSSAASAGCCCAAGRIWIGRSARPSATSSPSTAGWPKPTCSRNNGQLWSYTYEVAAHRFLTNWLLGLRWQRLPAFQKLGFLLVQHLDGILNYCHEKVPSGKVEAINGNIRAMLRRGRGYRDHEYLLLKVQKATTTRRLCRTA